MSKNFMPPLDDSNFDLNAWYTRSPDEIRKAKEAQAYQAWRNLSPVGMSDEERAASRGDAVGADPNPSGAADANAAGRDASARTPRPLPAVGPGAKMMLDKIAGAEVPDAAKNGDPTGYDTQFGYGDLDPQLPKKPTTMTLDEVDTHQAKMQQAGHSSAMGRYQIQRPTLQDLRTRYRLDGSSIFTPQLQDQLGRTAMREVGYDAYCTGQKPFDGVHKGFIGKWASLPNNAGVSDHINPRTGQPQRTGMTLDEFRHALDEACRIDRSHPGAL